MSTPEQKVIEEFRQQFPDIAEAVQAVVNQGVSAVKAETESKLRPIEQRMEQDAQAKFTEALNKAVPDWQTICQAIPVAGVAE